MTSEPRRSLAPVVLGIVATVALLGFIGYVASQRRAVEARRPPDLIVTSPAPAAVVDSPLVVRFAASQPIELRAAGWGYQDLHLHARVNDVEYMPAAADIRTTGSLTYEWTLPAIRPGPATLQLAWGDLAHRELSAGASDTVRFRLK